MPSSAMCRIDELLHARVLLIHFLAAAARRAAPPLSVICSVAGTSFADHVGLCKGEIERSTDVSDGASCRHGAEGHDLRDMIVSVFAPDIVDHLAAPRVAEVHIDIGHGHALGVQKALEEQPIFHRVNFRDVQRIGHHRACRAAAPGSDRECPALFAKFTKSHTIRK